MRHFLFILLYLFLIMSLRAQIVDTLPFFVVKKGIYTSYTSLRNNTPNRLDSFRIITRTKADVFMVGGGPYTFELDSADHTEFRSLRSVLVGISDGVQFYISDKYTGGGKGISKCYLEGPYIFSLNRMHDTRNYSFGSAGYGVVIDIRTREHFPLDERFIKAMLKRYPGISAKYKDSDLMEYAIDILEAANEIEKAMSSIPH